MKTVQVVIPGRFIIPLNRPASSDSRDIQPADSDHMIDCSVFTKEEICNAIKQLRNSKSAGPDSIPIEAPKTDAGTSVELFYFWEETSAGRVEGMVPHQAP